MTLLAYDGEMNKEKANWLRAAVLGANDGIVSVAGLVIGVASATDDKLIILIAGLAGVFAGALSMAAGEYVSVGTQRDIEKVAHKNSGAQEPDHEHDLFSNPWHAAVASAAAFLVGSSIPMIAVMLPFGALTVPITFVSVVVALVFTGYLSAKLGGIHVKKSIVRNVVGGAIAMAVTYAIGSLFGVAM